MCPNDLILACDIPILTYRGGESESERDDDNDNDTDSDLQEAPELVPAAQTKTITRPEETVEKSADISEEEEREGEEDSDEERHVLVEVDERPREQWDCESILR